MSTASADRSKTPGILVVLILAGLWGCGDLAESGDSWSGTLAWEGGSHPTVAFHRESGQVLTAWVGTEDGGESWDVYLARVQAPDPGVENSPPGDVKVIQVNHLPGDAAPHEQAPAQVRVGPEGNIYVVWQTADWIPGREFPASELRLARSTDGGESFEDAITVNPSTDGVPASHTFHDIAVAPEGTILVSWIDGSTRALAEARGSSREEGGLPDQEIRVARSTDGGRSFHDPVVVDSNPCPCCRTALVVDRDGTAYLGWRKIFPGDIRDMVVARSDDGGRSFGPPARVADDDWEIAGCPHAGPGMALDEEGSLHVAWYTGKEGGPGIYMASSRDGAMTFSEPTPLLTAEWIPPARVALVYSLDSGITVAWEDGRESPGRLQSQRIPVGGSNATRVGGTEVEGRYPSLVAENGLQVLAWEDDEAVRLRIEW